MLIQPIFHPTQLPWRPFSGHLSHLCQNSRMKLSYHLTQESQFNTKDNQRIAGSNAFFTQNMVLSMKQAQVMVNRLSSHLKLSCTRTTALLRQRSWKIMLFTAQEGWVSYKHERVPSINGNIAEPTKVSTIWSNWGEQWQQWWLWWKARSLWSML